MPGNRLEPPFCKTEQLEVQSENRLLAVLSSKWDVWPKKAAIHRRPWEDIPTGHRRVYGCAFHSFNKPAVRIVSAIPESATFLSGWGKTV